MTSEPALKRIVSILINVQMEMHIWEPKCLGVVEHIMEKVLKIMEEERGQAKEVQNNR
jgi:hypothetical protein